ncbi:hypothetical protein CLAFUW4_08158 [Fulvia fulva]|uniref:Uncharacterized protein n=1 Tax=Passalora fulva TaxID=5499 RepID=A0A9Q8P6H9_PASFU|nr:uncharacterized protein CLAFUR5_08272 [Fulvia fulva]KAK4629190.1 hypothetical protein CLAFUR4_08163 [Fulvia fulva]KAK4630243.1 hypothetical protein CLAFUR0_08158 [Fulvia fulva]UJO14971.1 hypothetical protein CLAFUR5_08272 [Fulvia fulva]WPV12645.1 hypothetical protein CLAFUW4_08158 [Fulvia fulva]WPV27378.1 hypothetical protein CLAFUW7_08158 [Fulvia fulva]
MAALMNQAGAQASGEMAPSQPEKKPMSKLKEHLNLTQLCVSFPFLVDSSVGIRRPLLERTIIFIIMHLIHIGASTLMFKVHGTWAVLYAAAPAFAACGLAIHAAIHPEIERSEGRWMMSAYCANMMLAHLFSGVILAYICWLRLRNEGSEPDMAVDEEGGNAVLELLPDVDQSREKDIFDARA